MRLLRALMALQASKGSVSDEDLEVLELAAMMNGNPVGGTVVDICDYATGARLA